MTKSVRTWGRVFRPDRVISLPPLQPFPPLLSFTRARLLVGASLLLVVLMTPCALKAESIDRVAWLQGCWEMTSGTRVVEEAWTRPRGGIMLGVGRTTRDGALVEYETVLLHQEGDALAYEAHPSGQPAATFTAREASDTKVVFENAAHDFPQRVGYGRTVGDQLLAWVEGSINGRERRIEFAYRRIACP